MAEVKARSVIVWVQFGLGHPGAPGIGVVGAVVVTRKATFPFLISLAGMASLPVTVSAAGFCPGAWLPPWFVQVELTLAVALSVTSKSSLPRPARAPLAWSCRPLSKNEGIE